MRRPESWRGEVEASIDHSRRIEARTMPADFIMRIPQITDHGIDSRGASRARDRNPTMLRR
jgi:hypothetical protein